MIKRIFIIAFLWSAGVYASADAHASPGGLDAQGGHKDQRTQIYHCHTQQCEAHLSANKNNDQKSNLVSETQQAQLAGREYSLLYNRKDWSHWVDEDGDCQDTRAELLIASSQQVVKFKRNKACNVSHGEWFDPYTGKVFHQASDLDIDHIVPLSWAHKHGAANWSRAQKRTFANDSDNLIAVDKSANREKGDKAPDAWMPPNHLFWNEYRERFALIVKKYNLNAKE